MKTASPLIFVRHGSTQWNHAGRYQGTTDTPLSSIGITEAKQNAGLILGLINKGAIDAGRLQFVASPLRRARESAQIIATELSEKNIPVKPARDKSAPPITIIPSFRELSIGRWEGLTSQQVKDRFYEERKFRKTDRWNFRPKGGESMADRQEELTNALSQLPGNSVVVTHSVVIRLICHVLGGMNREDAAVFAMPHVTILWWDGVKLHRQPNNCQ